LDERPELELNEEVSSAVWIPFQWLLDPASASEYRLEFKDYRADYPAFHYDGYTVWGLTYRITENFMQVLGRRLPSHKRG
jgi:hypothetical protein